ncbi:MAG: hypothetical protein A3D96_06175 [Chlamydiae bacterium RIFCSPHIGHO2_12_FULL_44_59]|nr:MAG: hypothetical protein A2796_04000 [Chlamydiae bacterium RIFCSPHIGHO2_01_FULL_44_39]OGN57482.1 MAG: hypothetical protein A3C42_05895 [Chlamydiae bacterium RIFCSPHIGHO2_02_FULL_45_9]OGN61210.1 MAG: hypothetical protein A3D96_06175 [Chlamydiae bacterium RIFCSPHIGHO2_12_FULL_44_59]OGN65680.1 MAG: hypothetical protein A2978_06980 [Chlamydiae bacterium RIFCSPLOWO2_01_FULL_44_52]OGN68157.1 MAG: hypothetical protein A3I67_05650 [Chlamydiae bacterium RIFCSPLOWO2_02_FULL_45_22]OGN69045.1 MAG: hyp
MYELNTYPVTRIDLFAAFTHPEVIKKNLNDYKNCSMEMDRDLNSAIVEKAAGMSVLKACGASP